MAITANAPRPSLMLCDGILHPQLSHLFRVSYFIGTTEFKILTKQTTKLVYDLTTNMATAHIELPAKGAGVERILQQFTDPVHNSIVLVDYLDPVGNVSHSVRFDELTFKKCQIDNDYAAPQRTVTIELQFEFKSMIASYVDSSGEERAGRTE